MNNSPIKYNKKKPTRRRLPTFPNELSLSRLEPANLQRRLRWVRRRARLHVGELGVLGDLQQLVVRVSRAQEGVEAAHLPHDVLFHVFVEDEENVRVVSLLPALFDVLPEGSLGNCVSTLWDYCVY